MYRDFVKNVTKKYVYSFKQISTATAFIVKVKYDHKARNCETFNEI